MSQIASTSDAARARAFWPLAIATLAAALLGLVITAGPALAQDLRSPDAADAATSAPPTAVVDLRSPDTRDVAAPSVAASTGDLRSPDSRDAGAVSAAASGDRRSPDTRDLAQASSDAPTPVTDSGVDTWIYVAAGGVLLALVAGAATTRYVRHRHGVAPAS